MKHRRRIATMAATNLYLKCFVLAFNCAFVISTSGKLFVVSCPWVNVDTRCFAHMTTTVQMILIQVRDSKSLLQSFNVKPSHPAVYALGPLEGNRNKKMEKPLKDYPVRVFRSDYLFSVIVVTSSPVDTMADVVLAMPKRKCFQSYYTVTGIGSPFISVFSFDFSHTKVKVTFPQSDIKFSVNCFADKNCTPNQIVSFSMKKFACWHFGHNDRSLTLQNVVVTADRQIHVISGATAPLKRSLHAHKEPKDWGKTSLKASTAWGKIYIVPIASPSVVRFVFNTMQVPLNVTFHEIHGASPRQETYVIDSNQQENRGIFLYKGTLKNTLAVTANAPFGLYRVFYEFNPKIVQSGYRSILNLIPVEQWMQGAELVKSEIFVKERNCSRYDVIVQGQREDLIVTSETKITLTWRDPDIIIKGKLYCVGEINFVDEKARLYVNTSSGKMMLYGRVRSKKRFSSFLVAYPYDFNSAKIYQKGCKASKHFSSNDGIDNDCDGMVDEETKNGVDDDGDGRVDEDNVAAHSDGQWSRWYHICDRQCIDNRQRITVRKCLNRSPFGRDCEGDSILCNGELCQEFCTGHLEKNCFCNTHCASCQANYFKCDYCRRGYKPENHCIESCSDGSLRELQGGCPVPDSGIFLIILLIALPIILVVGVAISWVFWLRFRDSMETKRNTEEFCNDTDEQNVDYEMDDRFEFEPEPEVVKSERSGFLENLQKTISSTWKTPQGLNPKFEAIRTSIMMKPIREEDGGSQRSLNGGSKRSTVESHD